MDIQYNRAINDVEALKSWAGENCVPLVRVITFENAEELTEEGIPFLLLFHHPDDKTSPELYKNTIQNHFLHKKGEKCKQCIDVPPFCSIMMLM
jgi:endoplasmic reticulum resident protein 44